MPSKNSDIMRITEKTREEIENWRKKISEALKININLVTKKQGEIALRECSRYGKIPIKTLEDIMVGRIQ